MLNGKRLFSEQPPMPPSDNIFLFLATCKAGKNVPFLMKILIAKCLFDQQDTEEILNKKGGYSFQLVLLEGLLLV